ncbi:NUDIX hydrolase [Nocardioides piscis]|uniref:NUDIX domain-containing protein n=1 Tax=Nocardioides piscis TaxID=2714938 RepID=A0A6G7YFR7_9ACTN|nr:NUDIX domain-containing protein [Nocardioides piscis]QIK75662.1 NUDIX domain-containing protein [Nocardioides piscis]
MIHDDALAVLGAWAPPSPRDAALRERYLDHLHAHPDGLLRTCFPDHLTAGAVVVSHAGDAVLLNHHRKADAWLAFGGHVEPGDQTLAGAARRELVEESGLVEFDFDPVPLSLDEHAVEFCSDAGTVHHLDVRFLALASPDENHVVSEESNDVRWWPVAALPKTFEDMYLLIEAAVRRAREAHPRTSSAVRVSR